MRVQNTATLNSGSFGVCHYHWIGHNVRCLTSVTFVNLYLRHACVYTLHVKHLLVSK